MTDNPNHTPTALREALDRAGLTVREWAHKSGLTERTIYRFLRGETCHPETGARLARALKRRAVPS